MIQVVKVGDWAAALSITKGMEQRFGRAMDTAVKREAQKFRNDVLKAFRTSGRSNGKPWQRNEPWTIKRKKSSKPLIDKGDLYGSIIVIPVQESTYFVGIPNNARSDNGEKMTRIGAVHEYGHVITMQVTSKQFKYIMGLLRKYGPTGKKSSANKLRPGSTLVIRIPERSFLRETFKAHFKPGDVEARMMNFVAQKMGWQPGQKNPGTP
jgi:phage gpG-like protein